MKESDLKLAVSEYLQYGMNMGRWFFERMNSGSILAYGGGKPYKVKLCREGTSDFVVIRDADWIELKSDKGKQSQAQIDFQKLVEGFGHRYHIIREIEKLAEVLE